VSTGDLQPLLERREVVGAADDRSWLAMAGDDHPVMLTLDLVPNVHQPASEKVAGAASRVSAGPEDWEATVTY